MYPWVFGGGVRGWSLAVAALFLLASLVRPALLAPLNRLWTRFGALLHRIVSPIVLGIMFFGVITPMGLMRACWQGSAAPALRPQAASYWIDRASRRARRRNR